MTDFCEQIYGAYPVGDYIDGTPEDAGIVVAIAGLANILMSLLTIFWIKRQESIAQAAHEDEESRGLQTHAAKSVIFPVFIDLLWANVFVGLMSGVVTTFVKMEPHEDTSFLTTHLVAFDWAAQHWVLEGVSLLLLQKGCGNHAKKVAMKLATIWAMLIYVLVYLTFILTGAASFVFEILFSFVILLFYLIICFAPQKKLFRRPAAIEYAKIWISYRVAALVIVVSIFFNPMFNLCGYMVMQLLVFTFLEPLAIYWTLLQDSRWWQGDEVQTLGECLLYPYYRLRYGEAYFTNPRESHNYRFTIDGGKMASGMELRAPLAGIDYTLSTAQSLAMTMDDMKIHGQVQMLNFACVKIDWRGLLGSGSFSKVYRGSYRGKDVAIKLIYTHDLTADVIRRVAAEASILSSIRHPNIVNILGVTVLPPSVCLILERCSFGSLSDLIRGYGFDWNISQRPPLRLSYLDKMYLALGAARGLAAVHSHGPLIVHRDVKSFNFLVASDFTVKIADLELGNFVQPSEPRDSAQGIPKFLSRSTLFRYMRNTVSQQGSSIASGSEVSERDTVASSVNPSIADSTRETRQILDVVVVEDLLANWLAPEVILERRFQQESDLYSLGTVFWELISGRAPYEDNSQQEIREMISSGRTLDIPEEVSGTPFGQLIRRCWAIDPLRRPRAEEICARLETIVLNCCYNIIPPSTSLDVDFRCVDAFYNRIYKCRTLPFQDPNIKTAMAVGADINFHRSQTAISGRSLPVITEENSSIWSWMTNLFSRPKASQFSDSSAIQAHESALASVAPGSNAYIDEDEESGRSSTHSTGSRLSSYGFQNGNSGHSVNTLNSSALFIHNIPRVPEYSFDVKQSLEALRAEPFIKSLISSRENWCVLSRAPPHIVLFGTPSFYDLLDVPRSAEGSYHMLSLQSILRPELEVDTELSSSSNNFVAQAVANDEFLALRQSTSEKLLESLSQGEQSHGVLHLHLPSARLRYDQNAIRNLPILLREATRRQISVASDVSSDTFTVVSKRSALAVSTKLARNVMWTYHAYPIYRQDSRDSDSNFSEDSSTSTTEPINPSDRVDGSSFFKLSGLRQPTMQGGSKRKGTEIAFFVVSFQECDEKAISLPISNNNFNSFRGSLNSRGSESARSSLSMLSGFSKFLSIPKNNSTTISSACMNQLAAENPMVNEMELGDMRRNPPV